MIDFTFFLYTMLSKLVIYMVLQLSCSYTLKHSDVEKKWFIIDLDGVVLGRASVIIANLLRGKHKPTYTPHMDCGDYVIVVNAKKVFLTGKKLCNKVYYRHTGYPGGIKSTNPKRILSSSCPEKVLRMSVFGMMGKGPMSRKRLKNLKIFSGSEHVHHGQKPVKVDLCSLNRKNVGVL